jgi:hypothetical protein
MTTDKYPVAKVKIQNTTPHTFIPNDSRVHDAWPFTSLATIASVTNTFATVVRFITSTRLSWRNRNRYLP